jgi:tetracycline 7-halogenase / FADH2 O2-dependent halogenase
MKPPGKHKMPSPLGQSTLHHIFDGGWIWVIPFNNHRDATNPLTSVGMLLDRHKSPEPQGTAEQEFRRIVSTLPTVARHFEGATTVRPWIRSGRLQYSSPHHLAHRMLQLPHAAAFLDPLYSSGMSVLTVAVDLIAEELLKAVAEDDFAIDRFQFIEDVVNTGFDHYDMIVSRSFDSFASYDTWNAWNRHWALGNMLGAFGPLALLIKYLASHDPKYLAKTTEPGRIGVLGSHLPEVVATMRASQQDVDDATAGRITHAEAGRRMFERLGRLDFVPQYMGFGDPKQGATATFTLPAGAKHVNWYRFRAPKEWKERNTFPLSVYALEVVKFGLEEMASNWRRFSHAMRDVVFPGNNDWRYAPRALGAHGKKWMPIPPADQIDLDLAALEESPQIAGDVPTPSRVG